MEAKLVSGTMCNDSVIEQIKSPQIIVSDCAVHARKLLKLLCVNPFRRGGRVSGQADVAWVKTHSFALTRKLLAFYFIVCDSSLLKNQHVSRGFRITQ